MLNFDFIKKVPGVVIPKTKDELLAMVFPQGGDRHIVDYEVNGKRVTEVTVVRCKNAVAVNYTEDYMRKREPECLFIGDNLPTDKPTFKSAFNKKFEDMRAETMDWLGGQKLIAVPFMAGGEKYGYPAVMVVPNNAAFFAYALSGLQHFVEIEKYKGKFTPKLVIYVAPPFRHTHFKGKQVVVHCRSNEGKPYEMFSYNLYPGPSAKKGVYSFLIDIGEREGWITAHCSAVKLITPYDNEIVIMHEGASGGGKSEMGEQIHREPDGKIVIGQNLDTGEKFYVDIRETCALRQIVDDMGLVHPKFQKSGQKLAVTDAEDGWFVRVDGITEYGTSPYLEKMCTHPKQPLVFLNIQGSPQTTSLVWEHTIDSNGKACQNPRIILPRELIPNVINDPVEVDVRSFGIRVPPSSKERPDYGIIGMLHVIPPSLAWLWRLVSPRGFNNPSIVSTNQISSEGVGSYWPFATGKKVKQANLLLKQILDSPKTRYVLIPNQHVGSYKVGFMPQWISREYIARRGGIKFSPEHLVPARLPLLGYCLDSMKIDGQQIRRAFLRPETQVEVGLDGYDKGAKILVDFFKSELKQFITPELDPLGHKIIECFLKGGTLQDFIDLIPMKY